VDEESEPRVGTAEWIFTNVINKIVYTGRWFFVAAFIAWVGVALAFASKLRPLSKGEEFLKKDHPINAVLDRANEDFGNSGVFEMRLYILWGVKEIDKSAAS